MGPALAEGDRGASLAHVIQEVGSGGWAQIILVAAISWVMSWPKIRIVIKIMVSEITVNS